MKCRRWKLKGCFLGVCNVVGIGVKGVVLKARESGSKTSTRDCSWKAGCLFRTSFIISVVAAMHCNTLIHCGIVCRDYSKPFSFLGCQSFHGSPFPGVLPGSLVGLACRLASTSDHLSSW
ncbi:uncharacterized protein LOC144797654 [Lissotriton helveticus]